MNIVLICAFIIVSIPYIIAGVNGYMKIKQLGKLDVANPRSQDPNLTGAGFRSVSAQKNAWESIAFFMSMLFITYLAGVPLENVQIHVVIYTILRIIHPIVYIIGLSPLRTIIFTISIIPVLMMPFA